MLLKSLKGIGYKEFMNSKDREDKDSHHLIWNQKFFSRTFMSNKEVALSEIPRFVYRSPTFFQLLTECTWDVILLIIWNLLLFTGTYFAFIRYELQ